MLKTVRKDPTQLNNDAPVPQKAALQKIRRRIYARAALAVMTVLMTVVIIFGMTAAWYTNVVQTGGLIFRVEELGVNVNAVIGESNFTAKPGDIGIIPLTATNQGQDVVDITISASKSTLNKEMQKRLYFYVERQQTVNQETAQRTYLTDGSGYTYSVFSGEELALTELYHNNVQLKWCWVYDVLGYYVLGTSSDNTVAVQEYLRPIEYDYDNATFAANGTLLTVDGKTTREAFLQKLSETDGFLSPIQTNAAIGGYYPVEVDSSGYGVYVYLCSRDEVEANTDYDTALGHAAMRGETANYEVKITVNAAPAEQKTIAVTDADQLMHYLTDTSSQYNTIALAKNIELTQSIIIPEGRCVTLDLNGQTLTTTTARGIELEEGGALTVVNGVMAGNGGYGFTMQGAELTMRNVEMRKYSMCVRLEDYASDGRDSILRISNCDLFASTCALFTVGNGFDSEQKTTIIVENKCYLYSDNQTIAGNGTSTGDPRYGTDIQIINSTIESVPSATSAAISHPQKDSTLNIYKSVITGYTGIAVKGGTVTICESTVTGVGINPERPGNAVSGFTNTAAAISIETGYGYAIDVTVDATSTLESYYADAVAVYQRSAPQLTLNIQASEKNRTQLQGTADSTEVAQQLAAGNDVKLSANVTLSEAVTILAGTDVVLDLNGKTLTTTAAAAMTVAEGGSLTVVNGSMEGSDKAFVVQGGGLTLDGVNMSGYGTGVRIADDVATGKDSVVRISNCTMSGTDYGVHIMGNGDVSAQKTTLIIEDSELYGDVYALTGNGNATQAGTDIQIIRSNLRSNPSSPSAAIYHPQNDSTLTIRDSQLSGYTGMAIKGGTVNMENTQVTGTGANPAQPAHASSGFTDTAAAISIETSYQQPISVTVDATSTLESYYANAVVIYEDDSQYLTVNIQAKELDKTKESE